MSVFDLAGKTALITGASYGLGEVFAHRMADAGADLILTARSKELLEGVADACRAKGRKVTVATGDVAVEADVTRVVEAGIAAHGGIDILINNAGIADLRGLSAERYDVEMFKQIIDVDTVGVFLYAREVGRHMLERKKGSIVNICSIMGSGGNELNVIAYTAAKGAVRNMTLQLGCEWADRGVRVNSVSPGFIATEMTRAAIEGLGMAEYISSRTPMRRIGEADEVANAVIFLASDAASYITGVDLLVDGGTNASNGTYQVAPGHQSWGAKIGQPRVDGGYEGIVPLPERFAPWTFGIPGIHYEMPTQ
jgi:NAD(P)-dependent dehydrogenase (short-subunit alcohol dehydrogenase family)